MYLFMSYVLSELLIHIDHEGNPLLLRVVPLVNKVKYAERGERTHTWISAGSHFLLYLGQPFTTYYLHEVIILDHYLSMFLLRSTLQKWRGITYVCLFAWWTQQNTHE